MNGLKLSLELEFSAIRNNLFLLDFLYDYCIFPIFSSFEDLNKKRQKNNLASALIEHSPFIQTPLLS